MVHLTPGTPKVLYLDIAASKYTAGDATLTITSQLLENSYTSTARWISHDSRATRYSVDVGNVPSGIYVGELAKNGTTMYRFSIMVATADQLRPTSVAYTETTTDTAYEG